MVTPRILSFSPTVKQLPRLGLIWAAVIEQLAPDYPIERCLIGWGAKRSTRWPRSLGLPCIALEEGFLRALDLTPAAPMLSILFDEHGVHYDAHRPSRLESLILSAQKSDPLHTRAEALRATWVKARVTKYNHAAEPVGRTPPRGHILVIDQTVGDLSIQYGLANAKSFDRMLEAALDENPGCPIVVKVHPQVFAGRKRGYFRAMRGIRDSRVQLIGEDLHLPFLLEHAQAVYTVTSQVGFEALLWNKSVRVFGMPFYAGWGLTGDDLSAPTRRQKCSLPSLVRAALIDYPIYIDPATARITTVEETIARVAEHRRLAGLAS